MVRSSILSLASVLDGMIKLKPWTLEDWLIELYNYSLNYEPVYIFSYIRTSSYGMKSITTKDFTSHHSQNRTTVSIHFRSPRGCNRGPMYTMLCRNDLYNAGGNKSHIMQDYLDLTPRNKRRWTFQVIVAAKA